MGTIKLYRVITFYGGIVGVSAPMAKEAAERLARDTREAAGARRIVVDVMPAA